MDRVNPTSAFTVPAAADCTLTNYLVYIDTATATGDFYATTRRSLT